MDGFSFCALAELCSFWSQPDLVVQCGTAWFSVIWYNGCSTLWSGTVLGYFYQWVQCNVIKLHLDKKYTITKQYIVYLFCDLVEFDTILNGTTAQKNGGEQYNIWEESHWSYWGQSYDLSASCSSNDDDDHIYKMTVQSQKFSCRFLKKQLSEKIAV